MESLVRVMQSLRQPIHSFETTMLMMVAVAVIIWLSSPHLSLSFPSGPALPRAERPTGLPPGGSTSEPGSLDRAPSRVLPAEVVAGIEGQKKSNRRLLAEIRVLRCEMFADYLSSSAPTTGAARYARTVAAVKRLQRQNHC